MDQYSNKPERKIIDKEQGIAAIKLPVTRSQFSARKGSATVGGIREKWFEWDIISVGDCITKENARFTIREDGTTHWSSTVRSNDGGDSWYERFDYFDSGTNHLFTRPSQDHGDAWYFKEIRQDHTDFSWEQSNWTYDWRQFFDRVDYMKMDFDCHG